MNPFTPMSDPRENFFLQLSMQYQADKKGQIDVDSIPNPPN